VPETQGITLPVRVFSERRPAWSLLPWWLFSESSRNNRHDGCRRIVIGVSRSFAGDVAFRLTAESAKL